MQNDSHKDAIELVESRCSQHPMKVIIIGTAGGPIGGKSDIIRRMLEERGVDVVYQTLEQRDAYLQDRAPKWDLGIIDEFREFAPRDYQRIVIDNFDRLREVLEEDKPSPVPQYGVDGKQAHKASVGRSRAARAQRWR